MIFLYSFFSLFCLFVGFRDAAGRNAKIRKNAYYIRSVTRSFLVGQAFFCVLFALAVFMRIDFLVLEEVSARCVSIFGGYTVLVLCSFLPYSIPNWEVKSLSTVLLLGPMTMIQPIIICLGLGYASHPFLNRHVEMIFVMTAGFFCLFFEGILNRFGWSKHDALL